MNSPLPKDIYEFLADFRYRIRKFLRFSESAARAHGLTPKQHQLLLAVKGYPGRDSVTPSELAERLQITHHACVGLIDRCEQLGYVTRRANPEDGRSVLIEVTDQGLSILQTLSEIHVEEIKRIGFFNAE